MIYIFGDGRILYDSGLLTPGDKGKYIEVETLPDIESIDGKVGVITGCDLVKGEIIVAYFDIDKPAPAPAPAPEPTPPEPTEQEILQAEMLLNQQQIICKQMEQDAVLAELLLNQQGVDR